MTLQILAQFVGDRLKSNETVLILNWPPLELRRVVEPQPLLKPQKLLGRQGHVMLKLVNVPNNMVVDINITMFSNSIIIITTIR